MFSDQKCLFERAFECQTTVFNGLTVEWKTTPFIQNLEHGQVVYMLDCGRKFRSVRTILSKVKLAIESLINTAGAVKRTRRVIARTQAVVVLNSTSLQFS